MGRADPTGTRRADGWATAVPLVLLVVVLAVLVVAPIVLGRRVEAARARIDGLADPARAEVTVVQMALALEGVWLRRARDAGDPAAAGGYRAVVAREQAATARLGTSARALGGPVAARVEALAHAQRAWHAVADAVLAGSRAPALRHGADEAAFEAVILAAAQVDEAIGAAIARDRALLVAAEQRQRAMTVALAGAGLLGALAVAALARRTHRYARRLEDGRRALGAAQAARARLMRGVGHDLKNPLHVIDGHAALLADGVLGPLAAPQADSVARIRRGTRALALLVDDLLELGRAESGHLAVRPVPVALGTLVREMVGEYRAAAKAAQLGLTVTIANASCADASCADASCADASCAEPAAGRAAGPASEPAGNVAAGAFAGVSPDDGDGAFPLTTDPDRVRQVLGNLLSNAVKYTPAGGGVRVRVEPAPPMRARRSGASDFRGIRGVRGMPGDRPADIPGAGPGVLVTVANDGPGIPPDQRDSIFDEFTRLPTHAALPGSGLGLAIARRVARALGGELTLVEPAAQQQRIDDRDDTRGGTRGERQFEALSRTSTEALAGAGPGACFAFWLPVRPAAHGLASAPRPVPRGPHRPQPAA